MHFDLVIFDLDGTLVDSFEDICLSINQLLSGYELPVLNADSVREFIGKGVRHLIMCSLEVSGGTAIEIGEALRRYTDIYETRCLEHTRLYAGVARLLPRFFALPCAVLTNKPEAAARTILSFLGIADRFAFIAGGDTFDTMKPSAEPVLTLARMAGADPGRTLMVGDSVYDIQAAHAAGAVACAVTWGFQSPEMLKALKPRYTVSAFEDLLDIIGIESDAPDQLNR